MSLSKGKHLQLFPINVEKLSAKERHNYILNHYVLNKNAEGSDAPGGAEEPRKYKRDIDVIREHHRFLWDDSGVEAETLSWEKRLSLRYYRKLFKEYCIADLSHYRENKIALRWRVEKEVISGIGQFQCGSRHCTVREELRTWEVNFEYIEEGRSLNALVKLRLCPIHSEQLNYRSKKRELKRQQHKKKEERKEERKCKKRKHSKHAENQKEQELQETELHNQSSETEANEIESSNGDNVQNIGDVGGEEIWRQTSEQNEEKLTREQEFERYLEDLLL